MEASQSGRASGGKGWHDSQLAADDAQGMREGEPVGIDVLVPGCRDAIALRFYTLARKYPAAAAPFDFSLGALGAAAS